MATTTRDILNDFAHDLIALYQDADNMDSVTYDDLYTEMVDEYEEKIKIKYLHTD